MEHLACACVLERGECVVVKAESGTAVVGSVVGGGGLVGALEQELRMWCETVPMEEKTALRQWLHRYK